MEGIREKHTHIGRVPADERSHENRGRGGKPARMDSRASKQAVAGVCCEASAVCVFIAGKISRISARTKQWRRGKVAVFSGDKRRISEDSALSPVSETAFLRSPDQEQAHLL